jgi:hypothetical protein
MDEAKYYKTERGGVARLTNKVTLHSLGADGAWIPNQYAMNMFYDSTVDYWEITAEEVVKIIAEWKGTK